MKTALLPFSVLLTALSSFAAPTVSVSNPIVTFSVAAGAAAPAPQSVSVTSDQPVTLNSVTTSYVSGSGTTWLVASPLNGAGALPATIAIYVDPTGLTAGTYIGMVQVNAVGTVDPSSTTAITVFLIVGASGGGGMPTTTITAAPVSLSFSYQAGTAVPMPQLLTVTTNDSTSFNVSAVTNDGNAWLAATPSNSVSPGAILVSVNPTQLESGTYMGSVNLSVPPYSATQVPVTLTVGGPGLMLTPSSITISEPQNYGLSVNYPIQVTAPTTFRFIAFAASDSNWLSVDIPSGTTPATVNVRANDSSLAQGTYSGTVTVQTGPNSQFQIPVSLTVGPPATLGLQPASLVFTSTAGDPAPPSQSVKVNSISSSPQTFTATTNAPWLIATASPSTTPGLVTLTAITTGLTPGTYAALATIIPDGVGTSPQQVAVTLTVVSPPQPIISAVTNAASYASGAVAPGEFVTIFGANVGPRTIALPAPGTAPTSLGNTSVTFDGIAAPIIYALATQTTVQVPYNIAASQTVLVVTTQGVSSAAATLVSTPSYPGLFTADTSGQRQLAALNGDASMNSAANPVARGGIIVLYGTGEGKTSPSVVEGMIVPSTTTLPSAIAPVTVTIGGTVATLQYAGETPGTLAGLMQINAVVPANISPGSAIPVQVTVGGQSTQSNVTIAVK